MGERDAFGREKGEDPLAGLGWSSSAGTPTPTPVTPTPQPASVSTPGPTMTAGEPLTGGDAGTGGAPAWTPGPQASYTRRRRRRARGIIVPLVIIGFVAVAIGGATTAFNAGNDALNNFSNSIEQATKNDPTSTSNSPSSPGTSLTQSAALKAALAKLPAGDLQLLRLAPDRINANVIVKGKLHVVQVDAGGEVNDVSTPATGGGTGTIKVNSVAPSRIIKTATKRTGRRPSSVSYLVLIHILGKDEWQLYFDDGTHFSASANGKKVHRVG
ncbi:hypothetical protein OM076_24245 [Solirubrobacter ginsenosidimutans]|uniref:Uncharacterized protein n=1 Tax=Solirubrobacter ginsenosidimutans TaxID=490573 RepID=A0A9X3MXG0_9ACTN|nr:hypothetical protein [Solirubrobacter ginsenosidimutans]MDA0163406.1 hypothetical protein [Solirubrobacter ginsenosidimutans]